MPTWVPEVLQPVVQWALSPVVLGVLSVMSLVLFLASILALPWLVARLPEDYFSDDQQPPSAILEDKRAILALRVLRNVLGVLLLLAGISMLILPGQGLLAIVVALGLLEFRGKRRFQRRLVARPFVLSALNKIRKRASKPPLIMDSEESNS